MTPARTTAQTFGQALDEHLAALCARDVERFAATVGENAVVVDGAGAITRGTDAVLRSHAAWFRMAEPWAFAYEVVFARDTASSGLALLDVTYRHTPGAEPSRFLLSLVFERDANGAFKFVYDQNTPLPRLSADGAG